MIGEFLRRLRYFLHRRQFEAELDEEMRHHLAMKEAESGAPAQKQFGNITLLKEESRAMWTWTLWEQLMQDVRYAMRTMMRNPAFTALAVLSLALGIGANTAIYSFMDSILLRALPVADPESLVVLNWHAKASESTPVVHSLEGNVYRDPISGVTASAFPFPALEFLRKNGAVFDSIFAFYREDEVNKPPKGRPRLRACNMSQATIFEALGFTPQRDAC